MRSREPSLTIVAGGSEVTMITRNAAGGSSSAPAQKLSSPSPAFLEIPGAGGSSSPTAVVVTPSRRGSKIMKGIYSSIREFKLR